MNRGFLSIVAALSLAVTVAACDEASKPTETLTIVSGSENQGLEPVIQEWARGKGYAVDVSYKGSVDISRCLEQGPACEFDAVWPANSLWIELGDRQGVVKHGASILRSPVVLGLKCSIAESLGWKDNPNVTTNDILKASEAGTFRLAMTSATQSNSGASAYIGALYAMAGSPDLLTSAHLGDAAVQDKVKRFLATIDRGSGSSGWLKNAVVENPDRFDAMINYEAMIIEGNRGWTDKHGNHVQGLVERGHEPLCAVYPVDGLMVADSPLGYVNRGSAEKEALFKELQAHLLSKEVQAQLGAAGRRTGLIGLDVDNVDKSVFNPAWGIDTSRTIAPVPTPPADVIREALNLYQTGLRKPSLTIWVLDVSGSMEGTGIDGLRKAMFSLLDAQTATANLLQTGKRDVTIVIPFNSRVQTVWKIDGNEPAKLSELLGNTQGLQAGGGTDLYAALMEALRQLETYHKDGTLWDYLPAIVAMTDGASDRENKPRFEAMLQGLSFGRDVPIHAIAFGQADETQLRELSEATIGRLFRSKGDLPQTLRKAKGYN